jgi:hypothetical protein
MILSSGNCETVQLTIQPKSQKKNSSGNSPFAQSPAYHSSTVGKDDQNEPASDIQT